MRDETKYKERDEQIRSISMPLNIHTWRDRYGEVVPDETIEYRDSSGEWREETDYRLGNISTALQQRGFISREELRKIGQWKAGGRVDHHLKQNSPQLVEEQSKLAFQASDDGDSVEPLTELQGVSVPVASTILTMYEPGVFAVVDFRAFRALGAANTQLLDSQDYHRYVEFMNHFQNYNTNPSAYLFYLEEVRGIAQHEDLVPREVDMALWAYDISMT